MKNPSIATRPDEVFPGHSEMAGIMRSFNWSATELGPPERWPASLCSAVRICLTSRFPILICWGPQLNVLYNDAYLPFLSERKRTRALMQPGRIVWSEIWDPIGPMLAGVMDTGVATWCEDFEFFFDRRLPQEEVFVSFSYGPIFSADGQKVAGVFCPCAENTEKVISARRLETLRRLGACSTNARVLTAACQQAAAVLRENPRDIPFAAIYVGAELEFRHVAGVTPDAQNRLPASVSHTDAAVHWPLAQVVHSREALECSDLEVMGVRIAGGAWPEHTRQALILPIQAARRELAGLLVVGVSPRRPLDAAYRSFFGLVAGHIASAISNAQAYEVQRKRRLEDSETGGSLLSDVGIDGSRGEHRPRVLFADDNADMRRYVERILSPRYELNIAMDGEGALTVARQYSPDLVLANVMMPQLDGFELLRALRADARTRDVPVILLSARAGEESRVEGLERGAADYLVKPFGARELLARIDARLEIARLHRANVAREQRLRTAAEQSEARMHDELVAEIEAMSRLHELSTRWLTNMPLEALLEDMLDSTIQLVKADFGSLQLCDAESRTLKLVAQRGFTQEFLDYFNLLEEGTAACGLALQRRTRVVVENVLTDPCFASHLHVVTAAAFQSMQSTPLISRKGEVLGVLSTHFREPRQLCARELRLLDLYARQAAELIERRQAEERLRRSEERFRRYFDLGLIGGALTSPDRGCLEVNDELCRILGYEREELLRKNWDDMTHPDDLAADISQFERVMASEIDGYLLDKRWIRKDGTIVDSIMAARAVRREDGTVDYLLGLVLDITARKRAEEALQRLQADLEHVWRIATIGEMASWIAHELTQPLAATIANANACACWLANEPKNMQEANAAVTRIVRDATRASLVIARIRALVTRREMERTPFHLGEVIRETISIAEAEIRRHEVSLGCKVAPDLPQAVGDRVHVQQVILNLLRNAVEAMESVLDRERLLMITVDALSEESLHVAVRDSGTGLPRQQRERVFDAFHSTKPTGMGMGLAISRSIVEAHGGRLWVTDNDGPGVTFQFTLPSAEAPEWGVRQTM